MQCALSTLIDNSFCGKYDLHADSQLSIMHRKFVSANGLCFQPSMPTVNLDIEYVLGNRTILVPNT